MAEPDMMPMDRISADSDMKYGAGSGYAQPYQQPYYGDRNNPSMSNLDRLVARTKECNGDLTNYVIFIHEPYRQQIACEPFMIQGFQGFPIVYTLNEFEHMTMSSIEGKRGFKCECGNDVFKKKQFVKFINKQEVSYFKRYCVKCKKDIDTKKAMEKEYLLEMDDEVKE